MNPVKLVILCSVLALAGCGDKDDADTAKSEGSVLDQAKEMTSSAADSATQAAADSGDAVSNMTENMQEGATSMAEQTGDEMDSGMDAAGDTVDSATATMGDMADSAGDTVADAADATADAADETVAEAASAVTPAAGGAATEADLAQGKTIYEGKCQACHATGAAGAPKNGDKANWAPRIAQGNDLLYQHAIEGFKGAVGYMPPKGGFTALTDDEVKAAVDYMVSQNQ